MGSIGIVGLGKQSGEYIRVIKNISGWVITAVCDQDHLIASRMASELNCSFFTSIEDMATAGKCDIYLLCLPHNQYFNAMSILAYPNCHFIKEKPFAFDLNEAHDTYSLLQRTGAFCSVLLKRRFNPAYQAACNMIGGIGNIYSAEFKYTLSIERLDEGWRASKAIAGGGAVIDMGYHLIDLIVWFLGEPDSVTAKISQCAKPEQNYDVEDTAHILLEYTSPFSRDNFVCSAVISRCYGNKQEEVRLVGTKGIIIVTPKEMLLSGHDGRTIEHISNNLSSDELLESQLHSLFNRSKDTYPEINEQLKHHHIIDAIYRSETHKITPNHYECLEGNANVQL